MRKVLGVILAILGVLGLVGQFLPQPNPSPESDISAKVIACAISVLMIIGGIALSSKKKESKDK